MATISKGITLSYKPEGQEQFLELENLQEIPELGSNFDAIEITTLADEAHVYTSGLQNFGDGIAFKFLYDEAVFGALLELNDTEVVWKVSIPNSLACVFAGVPALKLDGVGVNAVLTFTLTIRPTSPMDWE